MANAKHGGEIVAIHEQLPQDNLCSDDGIPAQECDVAAGNLQWPMATPSVNGDQLAPRFAGYRDVSAADSRAPLPLQQQLAAERARKLLPSAQAQHHQQLGAAGAQPGGMTPNGSIGMMANGSPWPSQRVPTLDAASAVAPSLQPTAAAYALPTVATAVSAGAGYPLLQQRSPSSSWLPALDSAAVASAAAATSVTGSSESPVLHQLLSRVRELEEADRRNFSSREDAYRLQVQNLQLRIDDLQADRNSLLAENEQLKNALGAAASAARSMAVAAASQQQDADSGFPMSTSSSSVADRRSSTSDDTYKRRIADLQQQLELYKDEMQKQYDDNRLLTEEKKLLQKRLSAVGCAGVTGPAAAAASSQLTQAGLDSGVASSVHGQPTCSSTVSSSQELSVDAVRAIMQKVQKSREAVDELKDVVRRQTDIIKSYKTVIEKTLKQQGDTTSGGGGLVSAGAAVPARATPTKAVFQHWDGGSTRQQQQQLLSQKTAVSARGGAGAAGNGLMATVTAGGATTLSPALFSYAFPAGHLAVGTSVAAAAAAGSAAAQLPPPTVPAAGSREAVEQSDLTRSLVCTASATAAAAGGSLWPKDDELSVGSARTMLYCPSLNESCENDSLFSEIASTIAVASPRHGDTKLLPQQQSLRCGIGPLPLPPAAEIAVPTAPASDYSALGLPCGKAATDVVIAVSSPGDYRVCPVCNARFSSQTPLDRLQEHILDCEGTSAPLPALQQQQPSPPSSPPCGAATIVAADTPSAGGSNSSGERTCPMCCAHFPPELPQREYELHVMAHFDDDGFVVAGREPLPPDAL